MSRLSLPINQGWHFREKGLPPSTFLPVAQFPTNVHLDLLRHELIPDANSGKNENAAQWVGEKSWLYRTEFSYPKFTNGNVVLAFDGLDTHATVTFNGVTILNTNSMFIPERVDVTELMCFSDIVNVLEILFESTFLIGKKMLENNTNHYWGCWNGDPSRLAVRKAQYHYV